MKIVIIEDEKITANDLVATLNSLSADNEIVSVLSSVKTAIIYFQNNESPDLIFSDVQLGDGLSFEVFKAVKIAAPVIFCTAYDEYALNAFKTNGIDYVLKPFTSDAIADAMGKYHQLQQTFSGKDSQYKALLETLINRDSPKTSAVLVYQGDKIMPVRLEDIALFYIENGITYLLIFDNKNYSINKNLDELEQLCGNSFFRVNRQFLVNRKAVRDASHYFSRKLSVNISIPFKEKITVSKEKTPQFLNWLESIK